MAIGNNTAALQQILEAVGNLPEGSNVRLQQKSVTPSARSQEVEPDSGYDGLSKVTVEGDSDLVAGNIKQGVNIFGVTGNLQTGVTVQRKTGTFTTNSDGLGGVECGFQPDLVMIHVGVIDNYENNLVFNFTESFTDNSSFTVACRDPVYAFIQANGGRNGDNGFYAYIAAYDWDWSFHEVERTFSYVAVKYT